MFTIWLLPACFVAALAYAAVGLGGGSTYVALLALAGWGHAALPVTSLALNVIVAGGGLYHYARAGHVRASLLLPFAAASIPASFLAGQVSLPAAAFKALLAAALMLAAARMLFWRESLLRPRQVPVAEAWLWGPPVGLVLGLVAGWVGIAGGIFLGPFLMLMGWADGKRAAGAASGFILLNSLAGLGGHVAGGRVPDPAAWPLAAAVLIGGQIGAGLGARRLSPLVLQRAMGILVFAVALKIGWDAMR